MYKGQERRKYKRIEKPYMARFQIRSDEAQEMESDDWDSVTLRNLSAGGTYFFHKKDLGIGTLLDLKIDVSKYAYHKLYWESNTSQIYSASLYTSYSNRIYRD